MFQKFKNVALAAMVAMVTAIAATTPAYAQLDVAPLVTSLESAETGIGLVIGAAMLVLGIIVGWRYLKKGAN